MIAQESPIPSDSQHGDRFARPSKLLAVLSFVCGMLSIPLAIVVVGALFGVAGLVFGVTQLVTSRAGRGFAWTGAVLSAIGLIASIVVFVALLSSFHYGLSNINKSESLEAWVGAAAPDFIAQDADGGYLQLANFRGKRVLLAFSSPHCQFCERESAYLSELHSAVSADELAIIGVSGQDAQTLSALVKENHISYPVVSAVSLPPPYSEITAFPSAIVVDRDGIIRKILVGYSSLDELKTNAIGSDAATHTPPAPAQSSATYSRGAP